MPATALTGTRVRERRQVMGLRQTDLARAAGISASYLNLIEHNRRRIGADVLARLADALSTEPAALAEGAEGARLEDLRAAAAAAPPGVQPELDRAEDFLGRFPGWADLVAAQQARLDHLDQMVAALNDRISHDPHLSAALHEVLSAVSSVRSTAAILAETEDIAPDWRARFHANLHADSERLAQGAETLVAYLDSAGDAAEPQTVSAPQEELETWLAARGWHLPDLEPGGGGADALEPALADLASGAARVLARAWIAQAAADARAVPLAALEGTDAPDAALVAAACGADVAAVMRRIATRPGAPEGLVICDASGALLLRKPVEGFLLPRHGAACPLWPLYTALARPGTPVEALAEMPGPVARRYRLRAWAALSHPQGFGGVELRQAVMLIAPEPGPAPAQVLRLGGSCRICPRDGCPARREPSILSEPALARIAERDLHAQAIAGFDKPPALRR